MIGYLAGTVREKHNDVWIIQPDGLGIGYEITLAPTLFEEGITDVELNIYHHITEQSQKLFGFSSHAEKAFFQKLISVNGLGPKGGISLMNLGLETLQKAIVSEDEKTITSANGVGPKLAKKIILDLKGSIDLSSVWGNNDTSSHGNTLGEVHAHVAEALTQMGYDKKRVAEILKGSPHELITVEQLIQYSLRELSA